MTDAIIWILIIGCVVFSILLILLLIFFFAKFKFRIVVHNKDIKIYWRKDVIYDSMDEYDYVDDVKELSFEKKYKKMKYIINLIRKILDDKNDDIIYILKYVKKTFTVKRLDISLDYGFDDAAMTGITGGVIWSLISGLSAFVGRFIDFRKFTNIAVKPYYTEEILDFNLECVFDVSIYNY